MKPSAFVTAFAAAAAFTLPASAQMTGEIRVAGSSTVAPITVRIAEDFQQEHPGVNVPIDITGTGGGFKRFTVGDTDINNASRVIKVSEARKAAENGVAFIELPVAYDGLSIVVNEENDFLEKLTVDQLRSIFLADSRIQRWSDVDPSYPDMPLSIYMPGTDSGTFDYFKEVVAGDDGSIRSDVTVSEDDNVLVRGVVGDRGAIGFFGSAYYFANEDQLRAVKIVNPQTGQAMAPTPGSIEEGTYAPFSRPLFIYINAESMDRPEVKAFVDYYLNAAASAAEAAGYVRLPRDFYRAAEQRVREQTLGSAFYDENMEEQHGSLRELYDIR